MNGRGNGRPRSDDEMAPSVRTYGSKRPCWQDKRQHTAAKNISSYHGCSRQARGSSGMLDTDHEGQGVVNEISTITDGIAIERYGAKDGDRFPPREDEIAELIRRAKAGGYRGRGSATALAKACKLSETRKVFRRQGKILGDLTEALSSSLGVDRKLRDEALIYCFVVALYILSKDASVAKEFSASAVSTLASLIEDDPIVSRRAVTGASSRLSPNDIELLQKDRKSLSVSSIEGTGQMRESSASLTNDHESPAFKSQVHQHEGSRSKSQLHHVGSYEGTSVKGGVIARRPRENTASTCATLEKDVLSVAPCDSTEHHRGSADALVRARMLLDISDMIPWGMANRHLVSSSDLGLTTLLNVAYQACAGGRDGGGGIGSGGGGADSLDNDLGTQDSGASQSEPSQSDSCSLRPVGSLTTATTEGETLRNTGVMQKLSHLGPRGFLLSIVINGGATLEALSTPQAAGSRNAGAGGSPSGVDPSSQRELHRLLQGLRLLDLATLHPSDDDLEDTAASGRVGGKMELTGAVLRVVSHCRALIGDRRDSRSSHGSPSPVAISRTIRGHKTKHGRNPSRCFGDEIALRVHECLLAALRVLINITHHDSMVCQEVAARGGLATLVSCLVAHGDGFAASGGGSGLTRKEPTGFLRRGMEVGADEMPDGGFIGTTEHEVDNRGKSDGPESTTEDFDVQVLTLGALINCVELRETTENCAVMGTLSVPSSTSTPKATGLTISTKTGDTWCNAVEFLARMLMKCTEGFTKHLEMCNGDEEAEGERRMLSTGAGTAASPGDVLQRKPDQGSSPARTTRGSENGTPPLTAGVESEEVMTPAEGAQLVLAGHCALLLGLLVREHEPNRRVALSVLPDHSATLIIRVLEAFMALQLQAGVLTEEVVLAVQELVEELEGLDPLPEGKEYDNREGEEENPYKLDDEDPAAEPALSPATISPVRKHRKRSRSPTRPPPPRSSTFALGQWVSDNFEDYNEDEFERSVSRVRRKVNQGSRTVPRLPQADNRGSPWRPGGNRGAPWISTPSRSVLESPGTRDERSLESPDATARLKKDWRLSPTIPYPSPTSPPVGRTAGVRVGLGGLGSGGVAGTRSWLGKSNQRTYATASWRKPLQAIGDVISAYTDAGPETERILEATSGPTKSTETCTNVSREDKRDGNGTSSSSDRVFGPKNGRACPTGAINPVVELDMRSKPSGRSPQPENRSDVDTHVEDAGGLHPKKGCEGGLTLTMDAESKENGTGSSSPVPVKGGVFPKPPGVGPRSGADARRFQQKTSRLPTESTGSRTSTCATNGARPQPRAATAMSRVYGRHRNDVSGSSAVGLSVRPDQLPGSGAEQPKPDVTAGVWCKDSGGRSSPRSHDAFEFENDSD